MKQNYFIYLLVISFSCIALIFAYHFFVKTLDLDFEVNMGSSKKIPESKHYFVLIVQEFESHYLQELFKGGQAAADEHGASIEYWGTKQTNIDGHIKLLEMAIASKVDGILTQGLSNEFVPVIEKAIDKGIPIILVDSNLDNNEFFPYVGTNNYQAGFEIGQAVVNETEGNIKIGIITGSLIANNLNERVQGFLDVINNEDRLEVVAIESSNLSKIQGAEKTFQILRNNPDISVFFGTSAPDSLGISEGIKKVNPSKHIQIYAFDDLEETMDLIQDGEIHATLKQEPYEMGYRGVHLLVDLINGKEINKDFYTSTTILKKKDIQNGTE